ncbi:MAG: helix-turn-helix domain-containing protein [Aliishimia sp.]
MGTVYTQLSMQKHRRIEDWWHAKVPVTEMARALRRHKSTIFREITRNFWADDSLSKKYTGYFGMAAYQCTQRRRSAQRKLIWYPELCQRILSLHLFQGRHRTRIVVVPALAQKEPHSSPRP